MASQNSVLAYDAERNADVFYKEIPDGANTLEFGYIHGNNKPMLIVGGNCSIQGFDEEAEEKFWTVTGDNVSATCFCDINNDGHPELIVGSDDYMIRAFKAENPVFEISEASKIIHLVTIKENYFAYGLDNGSLGVYKEKQRLWRVKAKHKVVSVVCV
mmetsp:Transcript_24755/g.21946  ORF Transcript_24755/g.21946 Transcript_24755/m.21946 type:complete len:158 (+) Transcript_24755:275-748(+)